MSDDILIEKSVEDEWYLIWDGYGRVLCEDGEWETVHSIPTLIARKTVELLQHRPSNAICIREDEIDTTMKKFDMKRKKINDNFIS